MSLRLLACAVFGQCIAHGMVKTTYGEIAAYMARHEDGTLETGGNVEAPFTEGTWQQEIISVAVLQLLAAKRRPHADSKPEIAVQRAIYLLAAPKPPLTAVSACRSAEDVACHVLEQCKAHGLEGTTTMRLLCYIAVFGSPNCGSYDVEKLPNPTAAQKLISEAAAELRESVSSGCSYADSLAHISTARGAMEQLPYFV